MHARQVTHFLDDLERPVTDILLVVVLAGYVLAGLRMALSLPVGHGPDAALHLQYVRFVADTHQLPTAVLPPEANVASQESTQPPLFYLVAAGLAGWTARPPIAEPGSDLLARVFAWRSKADADSGPSALYASPPDLWPKSTVVSGYAVRLVSLLAGFLALGCLFGLLRSLSGSRWLALAGTAWLGWNFNFPYIHTFVSNDAFLALFATAVLWQTARIMDLAGRGAVSDRSLVWLGVWLGALALVKLNGLIILPVAILVVLRAMPGRRVRALVIVGGVLLIVAGWWYARNLWLYGDLTGLRMMAAIEGAKGGLYLSLANWVRVRSILVDAILSLLFYYRLWLPLVLVNFLAFAGAVFAGARREWRARVIFLGAIVLLAVLAYGAWAQRFVYGTAPRLLLPAWPALAGLWVIGIAAWLPRRYYALVPLIILPMMGWHLVDVVDRKWSDGGSPVSYTFIPVLSTYDQPRLDRTWDVKFESHLTLTGSQLIRQGDQAIVALHWQLGEGIRDLETSFYVHLVDAAGAKVAQVDTFYQKDPLPLPSWRRGQTVVCLYRLRIPQDASGPLEVYVGVYSRGTMRTMSAAENGVDIPGGNLMIGRLPAGQ